MELANIGDAKKWFEVLQTGGKAQTAMMTLSPGQSSGNKEAHDKSEQVFLLLEGELQAEIGDDETRMQKGDVALIPAGVKHRFTNNGKTKAVTFNVYSPPEY